MKLTPYTTTLMSALLAALCTTAPGLAAEKLTVTTGSTSLIHGPLYVAAELGLFEDAGLDVEIVDMKGGTKDIAALASRGVQICSCATTSVVGAQTKGLDLKLFGSVTVQYDANLVVQGDLAREAGITIDSPLETKGKALVGKTIGVTTPGSGTDQMLRYFAKKAGVNPDRDMTITYLGSPSAAVAAFERKRIDGYLMSSPSAQLGEVEAGGVIVFQPVRAEIPTLQDLLYVSLTARTDWLEANRETAGHFMSAFQKALDVIQNEPDKARDAVYKRAFDRTDKKVFDRAWQDALKTYAKDTSIDPAAGERLIEFYNEASGSSLTFDPAIIAKVPAVQ